MRAIKRGHPMNMAPQQTLRPLRRCLVAISAALAMSCSSGSRKEAQTTRVTEWSCANARVSDAPLRRLTRFEYQNIISDVFDAQPDLNALLPRDEVALGFDNQAGALSVTDLHVEAYLNAANLVAQSVRDAPERVQQLAGCDEQTRQCAERTANALGRLLLRRPISSGEAERLLELFDGDFSATGYAEGLLRLVAALLQSPEFLYRVERSPNRDGETDGESGDAEHDDAQALEGAPSVLAARLSFLLWASGPDAELIEAVDSGELSTRSELERQARRMLEDPRARRGLLHFFEQWLELSTFHEVEKDPRLFSIWDHEVREHLAEETRHFLRQTLWHGDGRLETLLTARHSFATPLLMDFYELPIQDADEDEFVRVEFDDSSPRYGLLTQASLLSHLAKPDQTSPIHRGKFVRERFFCTVPPPPPPNIVVAAPRLDPRKTTRERFEEHRSEPACAGCHELLDPIGLAFEHYDAVGRYRSHEADTPVDASGYLVDTDIDGPVNGVGELALKLTESTEVRRCLVTQAFRYAFGRGETAADRCTLDKLTQQFAATDGDMLELIVSLTQTDPFTKPAPAPPAEAEDSP